MATHRAHTLRCESPQRGGIPRAARDAAQPRSECPRAPRRCATPHPSSRGIDAQGGTVAKWLPAAFSGITAAGLSESVIEGDNCRWHRRRRRPSASRRRLRRRRPPAASLPSLTFCRRGAAVPWPLLPITHLRLLAFLAGLPMQRCRQGPYRNSLAAPVRPSVRPPVRPRRSVCGLAQRAATTVYYSERDLIKPRKGPAPPCRHNNAEGSRGTAPREHKQCSGGEITGKCIVILGQIGGPRGTAATHRNAPDRVRRPLAFRKR